MFVELKEIEEHSGLNESIICLRNGNYEKKNRFFVNHPNGLYEVLVSRTWNSKEFDKIKELKRRLEVIMENIYWGFDDDEYSDALSELKNHFFNIQNKRMLATNKQAIFLFKNITNPQESELSITKDLPKAYLEFESINESLDFFNIEEITNKSSIVEIIKETIMHKESINNVFFF